MNASMAGRLVAHWGVIGLLLLNVSCFHVGQRLLHVEIEVDGKPAFEGIRGVRDDMPVERMWDVLGGIPFEAVSEEVPSAYPGSGQAFVLNGDVVVRIKHVDRELAAAHVPSVSLRRDAATKTWRLPLAEAERLKQAAQRR